MREFAKGTHRAAIRSFQTVGRTVVAGLICAATLIAATVQSSKAHTV